MRNLTFAVFVVSLPATMACSAAGTPTDAGFDAGLDAGFDAGLDAGPDAGFDAGLDAGPDAGFDAGLDAGFDAGQDGGPYCPAGFAFVPFLAATATTHTFSTAAQVLDPQKHYAAVVSTDVGRMVWTLLTGVAPIASNSLCFLALHHYFDGIAFHRVIDGFVAQGGDPTTLGTDRSVWGTGGPGYFFANEVNPTLNFTAAGQVAMANTGQPDSNGSQFFVTFAPLPTLDQGYTIFGNVTEGTSVLPLLARGTGSGMESPPPTPTRILEMHVCVQ